jgi:hypothetical protein
MSEKKPNQEWVERGAATDLIANAVAGATGGVAGAVTTQVMNGGLRRPKGEQPQKPAEPKKG